MSTTVEVDQALVDEASMLTGIASRRELIALALRELVERRKRKDLLDLAGQVAFSDDYDYKALREMRRGAG